MGNLFRLLNCMGCLLYEIAKLTFFCPRQSCSLFRVLLFLVKLSAGLHRPACKAEHASIRV